MNERVSARAMRRSLGRTTTAWILPITHSKRVLVPLLALILGLFLSACQPIEPSRWEGVQQETEGQEIVSEGKVIAGGEFNKFFPKPEDPFDITFLQEREGFAEAALEFEGEEVATLAVSDTANNPSARDKFEGSNEDLEGYPLAAVGNNGTAILVADRIQVQVRSKASDFAAEDREAWILEFDLDGLAALAD
jgi:hypothetical protein